MPVQVLESIQKMQKSRRNFLVFFIAWQSGTLPLVHALVPSSWTHSHVVDVGGHLGDDLGNGLGAGDDPVVDHGGGDVLRDRLHLSDGAHLRLDLDHGVEDGLTHDGGLHLMLGHDVGLEEGAGQPVVLGHPLDLLDGPGGGNVLRDEVRLHQHAVHLGVVGLEDSGGHQVGLEHGVLHRDLKEKDSVSLCTINNNNNNSNNSRIKIEL